MNNKRCEYNHKCKERALFPFAGAYFCHKHLNRALSFFKRLRGEK